MRKTTYIITEWYPVHGCIIRRDQYGRYIVQHSLDLYGCACQNADTWSEALMAAKEMNK